MIFQEEISLTPFPRGFHLITDLVSEVILSSGIQTGTAQVFVLHTSASLSINENSDPSVRLDFESHLNKLVPENQAYYRHNYEGPDDMPAHIKSTLTQSNTTLSIINSELVLGIWQDVYLFEHRVNPKIRKILVHIVGE